MDVLLLRGQCVSVCCLHFMDSDVGGLCES